MKTLNKLLPMVGGGVWGIKSCISLKKVGQFYVY